MRQGLKPAFYAGVAYGPAEAVPLLQSFLTVVQVFKSSHAWAETVGDDAVFDAGVDFRADDAAVEKFIFGMVGAVADDARCPCARETGNFHQLIKRGCVYIERLCRRNELRRTLSLGRGSWVNGCCVRERQGSGGHKKVKR